MAWACSLHGCSQSRPCPLTCVASLLFICIRGASPDAIADIASSFTAPLPGLSSVNTQYTGQSAASNPVVVDHPATSNTGASASTPSNTGATSNTGVATVASNTGNTDGEATANSAPASDAAMSGNVKVVLMVGCVAGVAGVVGIVLLITRQMRKPRRAESRAVTPSRRQVVGPRTMLTDAGINVANVHATVRSNTPRAPRAPPSTPVVSTHGLTRGCGWGRGQCHGRTCSVSSSPALEHV